MKTTHWRCVLLALCYVARRGGLADELPYRHRGQLSPVEGGEVVKAVIIFDGAAKRPQASCARRRARSTA